MSGSRSYAIPGLPRFRLDPREWGIWGGLTETERANIWRRRRQAEHLARLTCARQVPT